MGSQLLTWAVHACLFTHLFTAAVFVEDQDLRFLEEPSSVFVDAHNHDLATFRCSVSPKSADTLWFHNDSPLLEGSPGVVKLSKHRLQVLVTAGGRPPTNASSLRPPHTHHAYQCAAQQRDLLILSSPARAIIAGEGCDKRPSVWAVAQSLTNEIIIIIRLFANMKI